MAKGFVEFSGLDPRTGETGTFRLARAEIDRVRRYAPERKGLDLYCVREIVRNPQVAFQGVRAVDDRFGERVQSVELPDAEGLCLAGVPGSRVAPAGGTERPPPGFTFTVFTDRRLTVWGWYWIESDRSNPACPIGWEQRFDRRIWPKT